MKKIILILSILLSSQVYSLDYNVNIVLEESEKVIFSKSTHIITDNKAEFLKHKKEPEEMFIKWIEKSCSDKYSFCEKAIEMEVEKNKALIKFVIYDYAKEDQELKMYFNFNKYISEGNYEEYNASETIALKHQETIINEKDKKRLKVIITENKQKD